MPGTSLESPTPVAGAARPSGDLLARSHPPWLHTTGAFPAAPSLRKPAATDAAPLQLSYPSPSSSKHTHNFYATLGSSVSLSLLRNVTIFFLHVLPENHELGELPAQGEA